MSSLIGYVLIRQDGWVRCFENRNGGGGLVLEGIYEEVLEELRLRTDGDTRFRFARMDGTKWDLPGSTWKQLERISKGWLACSKMGRAEKTCMRKTSKGNVFPDLELASMDARTTSATRGLTIRAYHCEVCNKFHTGKPAIWLAYHGGDVT